MIYKFEKNWCIGYSLYVEANSLEEAKKKSEEADWFEDGEEDCGGEGWWEDAGVFIGINEDEKPITSMDDVINAKDWRELDD